MADETGRVSGKQVVLPQVGVEVRSSHPVWNLEHNLEEGRNHGHLVLMLISKERNFENQGAPPFRF